jgi:hypothetical protein
MINQSITIQQTVDFLNSLIAIDREAISQLFAEHTACNCELMDHPAVQVQGLKVNDVLCGQVAPLGIINGLFGVYDDGPKKGYGTIYREVDEETGLIIKFGLLENK